MKYMKSVYYKIFYGQFREVQPAIDCQVEESTWREMNGDSPWEYATERRMVFFATHNHRYARIERLI